jgi:peptidoglycan glycosyltransferase
MATTKPQSLGQVISAEAAAQVGDAMLDVVTSGTGTSARVDGYLVAGKTGTAQVGSGSINSLFVGFAPYDNPTLAISVCVEGNGEDVRGYASNVASEVFAQCLNIQAMGVS